MRKKYTFFFSKSVIIGLLTLSFTEVFGQSASTDYFRSKTSGKWNELSSWESSSDNVNWVNATVTPTYKANTITIRSGHNINLTSSVSIDQLIIADGGRLTIDSYSGYLQINDGEEEADVDIQSGGILQVINSSSELNKPYLTVIYFDESSGDGSPTMNVAGTIIVGNGSSSVDSSYGAFGYANADQIIWNNGAILEWNTPSTVPIVAGKTFFPEVASSVVPIFRISKISTANVGGSKSTIINGLVELNGTTVNWSGNGTKIFRNGIIATGTGTMFRSEGTGTWQIGDTSAPNSAEIGGATGTLTLNNPNGINITSASNAILTSNTILTGGTFTNNGTLNLGTFALSGTSAFKSAAGSSLITSNPGGLVSAVAVTGTKTFEAGTHYTFNADTTTPFPTGTFGNPATLTFNNANVTSNGTSDLTVSGNVNINGTSIFALNSTNNNNLKLGGTMTVDVNATFDNNGENQIINSGSGAIVINGKFITKDKDGFLGSSAAISDITPTLGTASTVEYGLAGNQVVSPGLDYNNIAISGSGTKSFSDGNLTVNKLTTVNIGSSLSIKTTGDNVASNVLYAKKGLKNLGGTVTFENNAQLIQDADADNSGNIILVRNASVPSDMYNFWASPVKDQDLKVLYPTSQAKVMILNTATNAYTTISGNAISEIGKGYSIRGASNNDPHTTTNGNFAVTATFAGEPNNNNKSIALSTQNKRYNLIGNPYPSNLSLDVLYQDNANVLDLGTAISPSTVEPTMYFWDNLHHDSVIQIQNYSGVNYAVYNAVSKTGVSATNGDQTKKPNGWVKPGQGFIVKAKENNNANLTLNFVQSRTDGKKLRDAGVINTPYFKNTGNNITSANRFWLKLTTPNNIYNTVAIVYDDRAKDTYDMFDSTLMTTAANDIFYSLSSDNSKLAIQGRKTFTDSDKVVLGFKNYVTGMHSIAVAEKEGIFTHDQPIYIYDRVLGTTVDISNTPYSYNSVSGSDESRFEIVYKPDTVLGTSDHSLKGFVVYRDSDNFVVSSSKDLSIVELYDMTGKLVYSAKGRSNKHIIPAATLVSGVYVVKVLTNGDMYTKKIIK